MIDRSLRARFTEVTLLGKSPASAYVKLNRWIWNRLPPSLTALRPMRSYGAFLYSLAQLRAERRQYFGTFFLRNRPQLDLIRRVSDRSGRGSTLRMACLGCSNGAELYSILWTIRSARPDLNLIPWASDISNEILEMAQEGVYSLRAPELVEEPIFSRMHPHEMQQMFDIDLEGDKATVKSWIKEGIIWHLGDACARETRDRLGPQDIVVANNFLCHMDPPLPEKCLRSIARLVSPGGHLFVSGIDLDIRTKVALDLGWKPVRDLLEEIHDGDPRVRRDWPWEYWGLEPVDKRRHDWEVRYASAFQL